MEKAKVGTRGGAVNRLNKDSATSQSSMFVPITLRPDMSCCRTGGESEEHALGIFFQGPASSAAW